MQRQSHAKAAELGISLAEYIRRLVEQDIGEPRRKVDVSVIFNLVDEGPPTNIARDEDKMIGEALWQNYLRETGWTSPRTGAKPRAASKKKSR